MAMWWEVSWWSLGKFSLEQESGTFCVPGFRLLREGLILAEERAIWHLWGNKPQEQRQSSEDGRGERWKETRSLTMSLGHWAHTPWTCFISRLSVTWDSLCLGHLKLGLLFLQAKSTLNDIWYFSPLKITLFFFVCRYLCVYLKFLEIRNHDFFCILKKCFQF